MVIAFLLFFKYKHQEKYLCCFIQSFSIQKFSIILCKSEFRVLKLFLLMEVSGLEIFVQQTINLKMSKARWNGEDEEEMGEEKE